LKDYLYLIRDLYDGEEGVESRPKWLFSLLFFF